MTTDILKQICRIVSRISSFDTLRLLETIYPSPSVIWPAGSELESLEIQVIEAGALFDVTARAGSLRREQFNITIAVFHRMRTDWAGRHSEQLLHETESVVKHVETLVTELDGNFIEDESATELLVRPLIVSSYSPTQTNLDFPGFLLKEVRFTGGLNVGLV